MVPNAFGTAFGTVVLDCEQSPGLQTSLPPPQLSSVVVGAIGFCVSGTHAHWTGSLLKPFNICIKIIVLVHMLALGGFCTSTHW